MFLRKITKNIFWLRILFFAISYKRTYRLYGRDLQDIKNSTYAFLFAQPYISFGLSVVVKNFVQKHCVELSHLVCLPPVQ
jgi:hypothetical protein